MTLKSYIKNLEGRKIVSRKPRPLMPFLLAGAILILYIYSASLNKIIGLFLLIIFIFALIFAIIHYIIIKVLKS